VPTSTGTWHCTETRRSSVYATIRPYYYGRDRRRQTKERIRIPTMISMSPSSSTTRILYTMREKRRQKNRVAKTVISPYEYGPPNTELLTWERKQDSQDWQLTTYTTSSTYWQGPSRSQAASLYSRSYQVLAYGCASAEERNRDAPTTWLPVHLAPRILRCYCLTTKQA